MIKLPRFSKKKKPNQRKGLALLEVLLSISILGALFVTITSKYDIGDIFWKLGKTNQQASVRAIGSALKRFEEDHVGRLPGPTANDSTMITENEKPICKDLFSRAACNAVGAVSISELTVGEKYMVDIPIDLQYESPSIIITGYTIQLVQEGRIRIRATTNSGVSFTY